MRRWVALGVALVASGCSSLPTEDRFVRVRRLREDVEVLEREERLTYEELLWEQEDAAYTRRLPAALRLSATHHVLTAHRLAEILGSSPDDPFAAEEADRRRVLVRPWADAPYHLGAATDAAPAPAAGEE